MNQLLISLISEYQKDFHEHYHIQSSSSFRCMLSYTFHLHLKWRRLKREGAQKKVILVSLSLRTLNHQRQIAVLVLLKGILKSTLPIPFKGLHWTPPRMVLKIMVYSGTNWPCNVERHVNHYEICLPRKACHTQSKTKLIHLALSCITFTVGQLITFSVQMYYIYS